jgi:enamine deaminase RidA (YjgF/YER057c/UK114 family)
METDTMTQPPHPPTDTPPPPPHWTRTNVDTGTPWERAVGYSRAVRVGPLIFVTGTIAADIEGNLIGHGDPHEQTTVIIRKIATALAELGGTLEHVVATRIYVTDIDHWPEVGRAHREHFGDIRPCATMVEVTRLALPNALVEIEATAVRPT